MTFYMSRHGREHYDQLIETDPPVTAWEISFDQGTTWHAGTSLAPAEPGWYRWLIAGDRAEQGAAVVSLAVGDHQPIARATTNPEIVVRPLEDVHVT
jgi:hypothetical protein